MAEFEDRVAQLVRRMHTVWGEESRLAASEIWVSGDWNDGFTIRNGDTGPGGVVYLSAGEMNFLLWHVMGMSPMIGQALSVLTPEPVPAGATPAGDLSYVPQRQLKVWLPDDGEFFQVSGRGTIYQCGLPFSMEKPSDLTAMIAIIREERYRVVAVEYRVHDAPYRKGELVGVNVVKIEKTDVIARANEPSKPVRRFRK